MLFPKICLENALKNDLIPFKFKNKNINLRNMDNDEFNLITKENLRKLEKVLSDIKTWDYFYRNEAIVYIEETENNMLEKYGIKNGKDLYNICNLGAIYTEMDVLCIYGTYFIDPDHGFMITFPHGNFITKPSKNDKRTSIFTSGDSYIKDIYFDEKGSNNTKSIEDYLELIKIGNTSAEVPVFRALNKKSIIDIKSLNMILNENRIYEEMLTYYNTYPVIFNGRNNIKDLKDRFIENIWYIDEDKYKSFINIHFTPDITIHDQQVQLEFFFNGKNIKNINLVQVSQADLSHQSKSDYNIELSY